MTAPQQHHTRVVELGDGVVQAICDCGWRSARCGVDKTEGTMDALQLAKDAGDIHEWETALDEG